MSDLAVFETLERKALALFRSGLFAVRTPEEALAKIIAGHEMGIPPFAAITGINMIKGRATLSAGLMSTLVKNSPRWNYRVVESDDKHCLLEWTEDGKKCGESSFTIEEAQRAGLAGGDNWKKYPSDMLFARALSRGVRRHAAGVFAGSTVYVDGEIDNVPSEPQQPPEQPKQLPPQTFDDDLDLRCDEALQAIESCSDMDGLKEIFKVALNACNWTEGQKAKITAAKDKRKLQLTQEERK